MRIQSSLVLGLSGLILMAGRGTAQTRVVTGRVEDAATHQGIGGATVSAVGGIQAAHTNEQGAYRITLPRRK